MGKTLRSLLLIVLAAVLFAIWFGLHVLFGRVGTFEVGPLSIASPDLASINWIAVALSILAVLCLFRLKLGILKTLGICGAIGLVAMLLPI